MTRLSSIISEYRGKIRGNDGGDETNGIPFGNLYQYLLKKNIRRDLIRRLLHVDTITITNASKLKMWMLSGLIVESPASLSSRWCNSIVISIWIVYI